MGEWDVYQNRMGVRGNTRRVSHLNREIQSIESHLPDNLSYTEAVIYAPEYCFNVPEDDASQYAQRMNVAVINSDNLNEKMIMAMPGEEIENGSLVHWMDQYWIISEQDANNTVYRRSKMLQCNYLLKWIDAEHHIYTQWVAVEDGTKYLTGEYEDRSFVVTRGDSRIAITIARNAHTAKLGRLDRFLIDDELSLHKLAYALTKPLKFAGVYGGKGVYKFVLQEVNTTDDDNQELGIADYYKHFTHETDADGNPVLRTETATSPADPREGTTERGKWM
jgi:hypothetical protein